MSNLGLFVVGTLVTLLVMASMALLCWGAVLDGRDEQARLLAGEREQPGDSSFRGDDDAT